MIYYFLYQFIFICLQVNYYSSYKLNYYYCSYIHLKTLKILLSLSLPASSVLKMVFPLHLSSLIKFPCRFLSLLPHQSFQNHFILKNFFIQLIPLSMHRAALENLPFSNSISPYYIDLYVYFSWSSALVSMALLP